MKYANFYKPIESELKANDSVIVISSDKDYVINLGQRWVIESINEDGFICLKDDPTHYGYHPCRFEKIEETEI
jgi:hypothetical protein